MELFVTTAAAQRHAALMDLARETRVTVHLADERVVAAVADTVTPQGVVAVCRTRTDSLEVMLGDPLALAAGLVDVAEPGNAGTVIRVADGAGASGVVLAGRAVDPYNSKCVRASAGSIFHLPIPVVDDPVDLVKAAADAGLQVLAATGAGEIDVNDAEDAGLLRRPTLWLFGSEAHGLPAPVVDAADAGVRIPMYGDAESLNLATAAAVCLYASARAQRGARSVASDEPAQTDAW